MNPIDSTLPLGVTAAPSATTASMTDSDKQKLKDASVQLEATFTSYLMEEFNKGLPGTTDSFSSGVYADMFKQAIATKVAESDSGKGLAGKIYAETLKLANSPRAASEHTVFKSTSNTAASGAAPSTAPL